MIPPSFRPAVTDADYDVCASLSSLYDPDQPTTSREIRDSEVVVPEGTPRHREIMEVDGRPVAHIRAIQMFWSDSPDLFDTRCMAPRMSPDCFPLGMSRAIELATADGAKTLSTWSDERYPERIAWLLTQGFQETQRNPVSFLDVAGFPMETWQPTVDKCLGSGIEFKSYAELIADRGEAAYEPLWKLDETIMKDVPLPYDWKGIPLPEWIKMILTEERHWPTTMVALEDGEPVGETMFFRNEVDPSLATTGLTGVVRTHRRRGIAAALKVHSIGNAQRSGVRRLGTDNEENNPMFGLNVDLGFRAEYNQIGFERK